MDDQLATIVLEMHGQMGAITQMVTNIDEKVTLLRQEKQALHQRLDDMSEAHEIELRSVRSIAVEAQQEHVRLRRDMKLLAVMAVGIVSTVKFLWTKVAIMWR